MRRNPQFQDIMLCLTYKVNLCLHSLLQIVSASFKNHFQPPDVSRYLPLKNVTSSVDGVACDQCWTVLSVSASKTKKIEQKFLSNQLEHF